MYSGILGINQLPTPSMFQLALTLGNHFGYAVGDECFPCSGGGKDGGLAWAAADLSRSASPPHHRGRHVWGLPCRISQARAVPYLCQHCFSQASVNCDMLVISSACRLPWQLLRKGLNALVPDVDPVLVAAQSKSRTDMDHSCWQDLPLLQS